MVEDIQSLHFRGNDLVGVVFRFNLHAMKTGQNDAKYGFSVDEVVVMQSTGLTDKNGKEIFEGDIIRWGIHTGSVWWWGNGFVFGKDLGLSPCNQQAEVIGNIYENPDLLPHP